jgi:hypothetical protein
MDQEPESASGFEHGAMARMLRQKRALAFPPWPQANAGPARVGKETYFHGRILRDGKSSLENARQRRTPGTPIPPNDTWLAALARQHHLALYARDALKRDRAESRREPRAGLKTSRGADDRAAI